MNDEVQKVLNNYMEASYIFNEKNKNYRIDVFLDFNFLHIFCRDLKNKETRKVSILNNLITPLEIQELLNAYNELIIELFN